jgi:hypothetical protein
MREHAWKVAYYHVHTEERKEHAWPVFIGLKVEPLVQCARPYGTEAWMALCAASILSFLSEILIKTKSRLRVLCWDTPFLCQR